MLAKTDQLGGLYLGGYQAVMNHRFLKDHNITHIVNTAKGLEIFGPKYLVSKANVIIGLYDLRRVFFTKEAVDRAKKELHIDFLNTNWLDSTDYVISVEELVNSVNFIHTGRCNGGSVLVHCAQVSTL